MAIAALLLASQLAVPLTQSGHSLGKGLFFAVWASATLFGLWMKRAQFTLAFYLGSTSLLGLSAACLHAVRVELSRLDITLIVMSVGLAGVSFSLGRRGRGN